MLKAYSKVLGFSLSVALILQSVGCGTIMYPQRKGQKSGQIDVAVAALDAVGLLFMIIPGVIAFAVDFNNGAIYLPKSGKGLLNYNDLQKVRFDPRADVKASVEKILQQRTGLDIRLGQPNIEVFKLKSVDELPSHFAAALKFDKAGWIAEASSRLNGEPFF
jgi:hypothetical protein